ncbi:uncharacterized protein LOC114175299 [Vigna unguiculata]|uniref:uncharacterized protein LOC114175299 n=1 Tax=Vigna unguiculata TaxID=3917 RepID=UPI001016F4CD|nr:uncharacterized protein LOC114175299 [Vigna unguiculata]
MGHYAYECPTKKIVLLKDNGEYTSDSDDDDGEVEESDGELKPNVGELYMIRRMWEGQVKARMHLKGRIFFIQDVQLMDYKDVFPASVPDGLPPLRGIEHHIDLIPGAALPNRPAYRSNPQETKEIEKQVTELMSKGWVRDSMSPCAVPVIWCQKGWLMEDVF